MLQRHTYGDLIWIDAESLTEEEVAELAEEFGFEQGLVRELLVESYRPSLKKFSEHIYTALHFPALKHSHSESRKQEIDFIVGKHVIVTHRYDTIDTIHKFSKTFETEAITNPDESVIDNTAIVFSTILRKLYKSVAYELDHQNDELIEIESAILGGLEREMVTRLSKESLNLLIIEQVLSGHKEILPDLGREVVQFFDDADPAYTRAIQNEHDKATEKAGINRGLLNELRRTNDTLLQTKQNEITKNLTVIATVALPLLILADIFSANFTNMPLIDHPYGFVIALIIMLLTSALAFMVLKVKRWF